MKYQLINLGVTIMGSIFIFAHSQPAFSSKEATMKRAMQNISEHMMAEQLIFSHGGERQVASKSESMDFKAAIKELDAEIKKNSKDASLYESRGNLKGAIGKNKGALKDLNKAIQLNPKSDTAYNSRGSIKANMGKLKKAIKDFTKAIALNPKNYNAYNNRSAMKIVLEDYEGALEDINKALEMNPKNLQAQKNRDELLNIIKKKNKEH